MVDKTRPDRGERATPPETDPAAARARATLTVMTLMTAGGQAQNDPVSAGRAAAEGNEVRGIYPHCAG